MPAGFGIAQPSDGFAIDEYVGELRDIPIFDLRFLSGRHSPCGRFLQRAKPRTELLQICLIERLPPNTQYPMIQPSRINRFKFGVG